MQTEYRLINHYIASNPKFNNIAHMRVSALIFLILLTFSCSKDHNSVPDLINGNDSIPTFPVTVVERAATTAIITWPAAPAIYNADTVKYDIVLNGKEIKANLITNIDTLTNLSSDSSYSGRVYARSLSGDTASATFTLEKIGGYVIFSDFNGVTHCINILSGIHLWQTVVTSGARSMPTIVDSTVYINSNESGIFAINAKTGGTIWRKQFSNLESAGSSTNPIYKDGKIYTIAGNIRTGSKIYGLNSTNGQTIWSFSEASDDYQSNPVISNNLLFEYAMGMQQKIVAININTGTKSWEYITNCHISLNPAVYNGLLIFGGSDGKIYALNQTTGALAWSRNFSVSYSNHGSDFVSPKIFNNLVIVHSGNSGFYGLNATTGATVWNYGGGISYSSPAIGNNLLYFTSTELGAPYVIALNAATGVRVWKYAFGSSSVHPTPIFAKNRLYLGFNLVWNWGIQVLDATKGTFVTRLANNVSQVSPETVVAGDSTFYASESGMVQ
jgi:outer membrane protein assembly factor BamB